MPSLMTRMARMTQIFWAPVPPKETAPALSARGQSLARGTTERGGGVSVCRVCAEQEGRMDGAHCGGGVGSWEAVLMW
jgi:hypothetical protein